MAWIRDPDEDGDPLQAAGRAYLEACRRFDDAKFRADSRTAQVHEAQAWLEQAQSELDVCRAERDAAWRAWHQLAAPSPHEQENPAGTFAAGGPVDAGRRYTVGEHGPEELNQLAHDDRRSLARRQHAIDVTADILAGTGSTALQAVAFAYTIERYLAGGEV